jgi:hypothetical protein
MNLLFSSEITFLYVFFSVLTDDHRKTEAANFKGLFIAPGGKVCGIAVLCFFVFFAIYCCCFCKCDKRRARSNMFETSPNLFENRTELPAVVNPRVGVAYLPSSVATPLDPFEGVVPIDDSSPNQINISNIPELEIGIAKPPPSYEEVLKYDYHMLARGVPAVAPPTYSESIVMISND